MSEYRIGTNGWLFQKIVCWLIDHDDMTFGGFGYFRKGRFVETSRKYTCRRCGRIYFIDVTQGEKND